MLRSPFIVFALPRSRTAWLAHWLHGEAHPVGHDISIECDSPGAFVESFANGMRGTVETGAIVRWREIRKALPEAKLVTIRRPVGEVHMSLRSRGVDILDELLYREKCLKELEQSTNCSSYAFESLAEPDVRRHLWAELLPEAPFFPLIDRLLARVNIQVNFAERLTHLTRRRSAISDLLDATG